MASFDPNELGTKERHSLLLGAIAPRPIALVSTVDEFGHNNLSPFSFFNIFSSNPPVVIFSAARRVRDNTTKDTLHNAMQQKEVVINVVNYAITQQVKLKFGRIFVGCRRVCEERFDANSVRSSCA